MGKYKYGNSSEKKLNTCHEDIQLVMRKVLDLGLIDISIVCGHRQKAEQNRLFASRKSKVVYPFSRHNNFPSDAVDALPYINGDVSYNWNHCIFLAGLILAVAKIEGIEMIWGGNWDGDGEPITDQEFQDLGHFQLVVS